MSETLPLVSIVTPSYNQAQFIEETILSVLKQDYPNIEYIIIDGGSTDGSVEIIRQYEDRLAYWVSEPDRGQSHAINKGWQRSNGTILAWLNSDDIYKPNAVSRAVTTLLAHPTAGMVYGNCERVDAQGKRLTIKRPHSGALSEWVKLKCWIAQPTVFLRRSVLQQAGLFVDEQLEVVMDYDLWLRMLVLAPAIYLDGEPLAIDRDYLARKTHTLFARRMDEYLIVLQRFYEQYGERSELRQARRQAFAWVYFRLASAALSEGRAFPDALRWLMKSVSLDIRPVWETKRHTMGILKHGLRQMVLERR